MIERLKNEPAMIAVLLVLLLMAAMKLGLVPGEYHGEIVAAAVTVLGVIVRQLVTPTRKLSLGERDTEPPEVAVSEEIDTVASVSLPGQYEPPKGAA